MDCCNFPEYRPPYGWEYGYQQYGGVPAPYAPYAQTYFAQEYAASAQHDHYARYSYNYDHQHHQHADRADHSLLDYGGYASKESRARRALVRREADRARTRTPAHHLPLPPTPPLDCGSLVSRGGYCEPQVQWSHYQQMGGASTGLSGSWGGGAWTARAPVHRDPLRHLVAMHDHCSLKSTKGQNLSALDHLTPEIRSSSAPFSSYDEAMYAQRILESQRPRSRVAPEYVDYSPSVLDRLAVRSHPTDVRHPYESREQIKVEQPVRRSTPPQPEKPAPAMVPLPAFQQAFGSTEIGKFAEAFSRAEAAHDAEFEGETIAANLAVEIFPEWDASADAAWQAQQKPIKCEDTY